MIEDSIEVRHLGRTAFVFIFAVAAVLAQAPGAERFPPDSMKVTPLEMVEDQLATIWMRTPTGLVRFNGIRYQRVAAESGYEGGVPTAIAAMDGGAIVVASGKGLWRLLDGKFRRIAELPVAKMAIDGDWIVVFEPQAALVRYVNGQTTVKPITIPIPEARALRGYGGLSYVSAGKAYTLSIDDSGNTKLENIALPSNFQRAVELWKVTADRMLAVELDAYAWLSKPTGQSWKTDRINPWRTRHTLVSSASPIRAILWKPGLVSEVNPNVSNGPIVFNYFHSKSNARSVLAGRNGETYIGFEDMGIQRIHKESAIVSWDESEGFSGEVSGLATWHPSKVALLTTAGIYTAPPIPCCGAMYGPARWSPVPGIVSGFTVYSMLGIGDGSAWVSTSRGCFRLDQTGRVLAEFDNVGASPRGSGLRELHRTPDGRMWAASKGGMAELSESGGKFIEAQDLRNYVAGFARGFDGKSYAARVGRIDKYENGQWSSAVEPTCLHSERIRSIAQDKTGAWWVAFRQAAPVQRVTLEKGAWRCRSYGPEQGLPGSDTNSLFVDWSGVIWRGYRGGYQAGQYAGERVVWTNVSSKTGLAGGSASELGHFAELGGGVWLATADGISRISAAEHLINASVVPQPFVAEVREAAQTYLRTDNSDAMPDLAEGAELFIGRAIHGPFQTPEVIEWTTDASDGAWHRLMEGRIQVKSLPQQAEVFKLRYVGATSERALPLRRAVGPPPAAPAMEVARTSWLPWGVAFGTLALMGILAARRRKRPGTPRTSTAPALDFDPAELLTIPPGTLIRGRYKIKELIAIGGFAQLFRALDTADGSEVAVKRIHIEWYGKTEKSRSWLKRRFAQEVAALSMLHHPSIIGVRDSWIDDAGAPYLVTRFLHAPTLRSFLQQSTRTPLQVSLSLIDQLAEALSVSHHQGIVHCDVKPENVLIETTPNGTHRVILIDFGTSALRFQSSTLSGLTRPAGSVHYMAPEQVLGRYSTASDVYSLAITALEILIQTRIAELPIAPDGDLSDALGVWAVTQPEPLPRLWPHFAAALSFDPRKRPDSPRDWAAGLIAAANSPGGVPGEATL